MSTLPRRTAPESQGVWLGAESGEAWRREVGVASEVCDVWV